MQPQWCIARACAQADMCTGGPERASQCQHDSKMLTYNKLGHCQGCMVVRRCVYKQTHTKGVQVFYEHVMKMIWRPHTWTDVLAKRIKARSKPRPFRCIRSSLHGFKCYIRGKFRCITYSKIISAAWNMLDSTRSRDARPFSTSMPDGLPTCE